VIRYRDSEFPTIPLINRGDRGVSGPPISLDELPIDKAFSSKRASILQPKILLKKNLT
jgi:hypothetical protein